MTHRTPEGKSDEDWANWEAGAEARDRATRETDAPPVSAEQFHITNIQHWIDLSA